MQPAAPAAAACEAAARFSRGAGCHEVGERADVFVRCCDALGNAAPAPLGAGGLAVRAALEGRDGAWLEVPVSLAEDGGGADGSLRFTLSPDAVGALEARAPPARARAAAPGEGRVLSAGPVAVGRVGPLPTVPTVAGGTRRPRCRAAHLGACEQTDGRCTSRSAARRCPPRRSRRTWSPGPSTRPRASLRARGCRCCLPCLASRN